MKSNNRLLAALERGELWDGQNLKSIWTELNLEREKSSSIRGSKESDGVE